ncbi:SIMPL domain-containing protein [Pedobacter sp. SYSU D00535]|uniref:SIMPL domain-containing protein n=1 Tax=Pedobacter sp. SYSU D00535 TaxID=2810308 RepID=UPI001A96D7C2|nr:SIMPL domain-containing protein [Pedobacter sp. SYSU D00535]
MKYALSFICLLLSACNFRPHQKAETIRVTGEGKIRAKPDLVILTLQVSFTQPRMADAVRMTQQTVDSVLNILGRYSSNENDIKTSSISANKHYEYNGRANVFAGYQAEQSIDFVLHDIRKFTELTGNLLATKISSISQIQFDHSKADSLFREADLLAYDDALQSAKKLSSRANVELGKLVYISNAGSAATDHSGYSSNDEIQTFAKGYGGNGFKISPEVMEFRRTIISEYEID